MTVAKIHNLQNSPIKDGKLQTDQITDPAQVVYSVATTAVYSVATTDCTQKSSRVDNKEIMKTLQTI